MSTFIDTQSCLNLKASIAHSFDATKRQEIGVHAVGGKAPISHIAEHYQVSRKFIYEQKNTALDGIKKAFEEPLKDEDSKVLFYLPVTKQWLDQVVLALIFICRASYQNVGEFCRDILNYEISKSSVHNIVHEHLEKANVINREQDLSQVKEGLHDEIYQAGKPTLVGCCARSTYCYLLSQEETCDANSWGCNLLDLQERQKLAPDFTIIDGGSSARKGQKDAWPDIPARGDIFHALKPFLELVIYLENRAIDGLKEVEKLKHKIAKPRGKWKEECKQQDLQKKLIETEEASKKVILLSNDVEILYKWLQKDILSLVGPSHQDRTELLTFIVEELRQREGVYRNKIEPVRKYLENHSSNLLEFVHQMEMNFYCIAQQLEISLSDVYAIYQLEGFPPSCQMRWERHSTLQARLGQQFYLATLLINEVLDNTFRANSLVENINSRLRTYFTLRRELGNRYLGCLQFFLNHRRFMRSECPERVGKSPTELLTGETHKHWLEMLGFVLFKRAA